MVQMVLLLLPGSIEQKIRSNNKYAIENPDSYREPIKKGPRQAGPIKRIRILSFNVYNWFLR